MPEHDNLSHFTREAVLSVFLFQAKPKADLLNHIRTRTGQIFLAGDVTGLAKLSVPSSRLIGDYGGFDDNAAEGVIQAMQELSPNVQLNINMLKNVKACLDQAGIELPIRIIPTFLREIGSHLTANAITEVSVDFAYKLFNELCQHQCAATIGKRGRGDDIGATELCQVWIPGVVGLLRTVRHGVPLSITAIAEGVSLAIPNLRQGYDIYIEELELMY